MCFGGSFQANHSIYCSPFSFVQVIGKVPTISINKTDGCHVYLSESSINCEIVSAKSSEMNILVPDHGDYVRENSVYFY